ncbi:hypothetical protein HYT02_00160 [Candidatus Gottesmanbacteria bacterium]|nr:hypothetical protein [Candidatus Gottesmanbacteria bacterium]
MQAVSKHLKAVFFIVFLLGALAVALYLSQQRYIRPQAVAGQPDISFTTNPAISPGGNFDLIIQVAPNGAAFYAYEFIFNFDASKVSLQDTTVPENNFVKSSDTTVMYSNVNGNTITVSGAKTGTPYPSSGTYELLRVKMKALANATGTVNFTWDNSSTIADKQTNKVNGTFTIGGGGTTATVTVTTTPPQNGASLFFSSPKNSYSPGENLDLVLNLNSAGDSVKSLTFEFPYNDLAFEFQNPTGDLGQNNIVVDPNSGFDTGNAIRTIDTNNKIVRLILPTGTKPAVSGTKQLATVKFKIKSNTTIPSYDFRVDLTASVIYNLQTQNILSSTPVYSILIGNPTTPTPTLPANVIKVGSINFRAKTGVAGNAPIDFSLTQESFVTENGGGDILGQITGLIIKILSSGTLTPTPDPNAPKISFIVKFRSVSDQSGDNNPNQKVTLRVKGSGVFKEYRDIPVTHIGNGVYQATNVSLSGLTFVDNVAFFVKGPKHLAKEMPYGPQGSQYDWTAFELEGGDTIPQDGIVNSVDISRIIDLLEVPNQSQAQLDVGDLNYDGIVNGADVNELILTLSTKRDED